MIVITGGSGFIGSNIQARFYQLGKHTVVVDWLGNNGKWRNLAGHEPDELIAPEKLPDFLESSSCSIEAIIHMGAISDTTAHEGDSVWANNVDLSWLLWKWCCYQKVPLIYASSAATYGAAKKVGEFSDDPQKLKILRPLNLYGWSKHVFDQKVMKSVIDGKSPPQWVGLKLFNVYGPNEYHKEGMISVIKVKYDEITVGKAPQLFRSDTPGMGDGHQSRDFIWVGDVVEVVLWFIQHPLVSGIFNCGTGQSRTYLDMAQILCDAAGAKREVDFIDIPDKLKGKYQSFTCADIMRLRAVGYEKPFTTLEEGIHCYVEDYLHNDRLYV